MHCKRIQVHTWLIERALRYCTVYALRPSPKLRRHSLKTPCIHPSHLLLALLKMGSKENWLEDPTRMRSPVTFSLILALQEPRQPWWFTRTRSWRQVNYSTCLHDCAHASHEFGQLYNAQIRAFTWKPSINWWYTTHTHHRSRSPSKLKSTQSYWLTKARERQLMLSPSILPISLHASIASCCNVERDEIFEKPVSGVWTFSLIPSLPITQQTQGSPRSHVGSHRRSTSHLSHQRS